MIEIIKLKVKDSSVEVHYNDTDKENNTAEIQARYSQIPHKDLINAMKNMTKHLAMLCDLKESDEVRMCDDFEEFIFKPEHAKKLRQISDLLMSK